MSSTYGVVLKCRHKTTGQIVAIKKFKESDDDEQVKKTALREVKVLKALKHENIVSLLEVFRVRGKLYLVFEYVDKTLLEEIETNPEGIDAHTIKRLMWQLVRAIHFCHQHSIIHRDIKPENLLVSRNGVLKLCDFGFARPLAGAGAKYTEYVSTRWYRAPELLVGDVSYGKAVDVWSIGCMFAEITTGQPLFPGDSDIDQLYHIIKCLGHVTARQHELFRKNSLYVGVKLPLATETESLRMRFPQLDKASIDFLEQTIRDEPLDRWTCAELLQHPYFDNCRDTFEAELQHAIQRDLEDAAMLRKKRMRKQPPSTPLRSCGANTLSGRSSLLAQAMTTSSDDCSHAYEAPPVAKAALKPTFQPMVAAGTTTHCIPTNTPKDKLRASPYGNVQTGASGNSKKPTHGTGALSSSHSNSHSHNHSNGAGAGSSGYRLPTLHGTMPTLSTTNSTASVTQNGDTSPFSFTKRQLVPTILENHHSSSIASHTDTHSIAVPVAHLGVINKHASTRQSMTSHGSGRSTTTATSSGLVHPYSFGASGFASMGATPKPLLPPSSSYMRNNPYLAPQALAPSTSQAHKRTPHVLQHAPATRKNSISSGMGDAGDDSVALKKLSGAGGYADVASRVHPKKHATGTTLVVAGGSSYGAVSDNTLRGIYVPPRTSQSTTRGSERTTRSRREQDSSRAVAISK